MIAVFCCVIWAVALWIIAMRAAEQRAVDIGGANTAYVAVIAAGGVVAISAGRIPLHSTFALQAVAVAAIVDARCGYVFDALPAIGLLVAVSMALVEGTANTAVLGSLASGSALLAIWAASFGRGLGLGDVKLAAVLGAALGPVDGIIALGLSFTVGAALTLGLLATREASLGTPVRFGPYLLAGSLCLLAYHRLSAGVIG